MKRLTRDEMAARVARGRWHGSAGIDRNPQPQPIAPGTHRVNAGIMARRRTRSGHCKKNEGKTDLRRLDVRSPGRSKVPPWAALWVMVCCSRASPRVTLRIR